MDNVLTKEGWDYVIENLDFLPEDKSVREAMLKGFLSTFIGSC